MAPDTYSLKVLSILSRRARFSVSQIFRFLSLLILAFSFSESFSQTPGVIFKPAMGAGASVLDPNADGYVSATAAGFQSTDIGANSEIPYTPLPMLHNEPTSDLGPGPNCKFTDFVNYVSGGADHVVSMYVDANNNVLFRFRLGGGAPNSKGYSILIDVDQKFGFAGTHLDPNAILGNPGFEYEIVLLTNFAVKVNELDGTSVPVELASFPYEEYCQKSIAATTNCGDLDVFYDFYVPAGSLPFNLNIPLRMAANTIIAPHSAMHQNTISDLGGYNGGTSNVNSSWIDIIDPFYPTPLAPIQTGETFYPNRADEPVILGPVLGGATEVYGTSTESPAQIIIYANGIPICTTSVQINGNFSCTGLSPLGFNDTLTAVATTTFKSPSAPSAPVIVGSSCSEPPALVCFTNKGILVGAPAGAPVGTLLKLFKHTPTGRVLIDTGISAFINAGNGVHAFTGNGFFYKCNTNSINCHSGPNCFDDGTYFATATEPGKCESVPGPYSCVGNLTSAIPTIGNAEILTTTTLITGSNSVAGARVIVTANKREIASVTATGNTFSIPVSNLILGDVIEVSQVEGTSNSQDFKCIGISFPKTVITYSDKPILLSPLFVTSTEIDGLSSEAPGTQIIIYSNGIQIGSTTVTLDGTFELAVSGLQSAASITAKAIAPGEQPSVVSDPVIVYPQTSVVPVVSGPISEGNTQVSGTCNCANNTTIKVYADDYLIGTTTVSGNSWTLTNLSVVPPELYAGSEIYATATEVNKGEGPKSAIVTVGCGTYSYANVISVSASEVCYGEPVTVYIHNSDRSVLYMLHNGANTVNLSNSLAGNGGTLALTSFPLTGSQTIRISITRIGVIICSQIHSTTTAVLVAPMPDLDLQVSADNYACNGAVATVQVFGTDPNFTYQLRNTATNVLEAQAVIGNSGTVTLQTDTPPLVVTAYEIVVTGIVSPYCTYTLTTNGIITPGCAAVYTLATPKDYRKYQVSDVVAFVTDEDDTIAGAQLINNSQLPAGLIINAVTGQISVSDAALLLPGSYPVEIRTTGSSGFITDHLVTLVILLDTDNDGIPDYSDLDNNNDGISDLASNLGADAFGDHDGDGIPNFSDPEFVHPFYGFHEFLSTTFPDANNDGISDWFDIDLDGILNNYDIDSDGDGIPNTLEANNGFAPANYNVLTGTIDGPVGPNGLPDIAEIGENGASAFLIPDSDSDSYPDFLDVDSDNDGLPDNLESQDHNFFISPTGTDTDKDGLDDAYDLSCGCPGYVQAIEPVDFDLDGLPDYLDTDADDDLYYDLQEAIDTDGDLFIEAELSALAQAFVLSGGNPAYYNNTELHTSGLPAWMTDEYGYLDGQLAFLTPGSAYYHDSNKNGIADLFDSATFGTQQAPADTDLDGTPQFRQGGTFTPLPVRFISFAAKAVQNTAELTWVTASESGADYFELQRSQDGRNFAAIGRVAAKGNSQNPTQYHFKDLSPFAGTNYYRINQVDVSGKSEFSSMASLSFTSSTSLLLYPNPVSDRAVLKISLQNGGQLSVMITDIKGVPLQNFQVNAKEGANEITLDFNAYPAGEYLISVLGNQIIYNQKISKF